jgi:hypothetical protein
MVARIYAYQRRLRLRLPLVRTATLTPTVSAPGVQDAVALKDFAHGDEVCGLDCNRGRVG